ncbi:MAG TPA: transglutaminaseTgpA domain-containing protein [Gaiellaceae bacterium]|nr:transglutaminaseTgpA domain-containing protein [Gaiellaceae bacterium]
MVRTLVASVVAALAVTAAWLSLEEPRAIREAIVVAALGLVPALLNSRRLRLLALVPASLGAAWVAFGAEPWELLPFRDERVLAPTLRDAGSGVVDFYEVFLPFVPLRNPEMHSLVLCAVFGFTVAAALLVATRRPIAAAAVTVAGVGWPATLSGGSAIAFGTVALVAALAIPLVLRASSLRALAAGTAIAALVVGGAASASSVTTLGHSAALDWESWDLRGPAKEARSVRFVWNSDYTGIRFPPTKTVVLRVEGPTVPYYWRTTTLDRVSNGHWSEDLFWLDQVDRETRALDLPQLVPKRAGDPSNWLEQRIEVEALVDDHLAAAGTPVGLDARRFETIFQLSGGVLRVRDPVPAGQRYTVWSYAPDPSPRALASAPRRSPAAAGRFLEVDGRVFPAFDTPDRDRVMRVFLRDPSYGGYGWHTTMWSVARRVTRHTTTPYRAVLALESWFRRTGRFRYDESPPRIPGPPLEVFVTKTRAGYCQHFAGAMALMLRLLGVPARVAVGFTSGTMSDGAWVVTDHDAHAWVEVWFAGQGWIPFDPTPGRGTLSGSYSFASRSQEAVAALRRGELAGKAPAGPVRPPDIGVPPQGTSERAAPWIVGVGVFLGVVWMLGVGLGKAVRRRLRYLSRDPRRIAAASRQELEGFLRDQGAVVEPNATLVELQRTVRQELGLDGGAFAAAVARARYGPPDTVEVGARTARVELRRLLRAARRDLSIWERVRGFFSLRSLRSTGSA